MSHISYKVAQILTNIENFKQVLIDIHDIPVEEANSCGKAVFHHGLKRGVIDAFDGADIEKGKECDIPHAEQLQNTDVMQAVSFVMLKRRPDGQKE